MEGQRLIFKDSTVIENGRAGLADGFLWLWMPITMQEAAQIALNPAVTGKIYFVYGEEEAVYTGYTVCRNLMQDGGEVAVCLVKG